RDLTRSERLGYLKAVKCLMKLPAREEREAVFSRFEEFQATHIFLTERVHSVGQFLPWHRQLGTLYNNALREECGYHGPSAFWDWSRDADSHLPYVLRGFLHFKHSPIFDPVYGFGGDGVLGTYTLPPDPLNISFTNVGWYKGCIGDGPFKDVKVHRGPGKLATAHCIVRGIDDSWRPGVTTINVNEVLRTSETYELFRLTIDEITRGHIHGSGHGIVGGEMLNIYSAGADPLFYLHHANLDRIWWKWQSENPRKRMYDLSGPTTQGGTDTITLDFVMDFPALGPNVTVREIMDASKAPGCFTYVY
ncbi:Di-copper centre-containing protein, partial [Coprinopsis marcescibilis]